MTDTLSRWLSMGGYGFYVWSAYGALVLAIAVDALGALLPGFDDQQQIRHRGSCSVIGRVYGCKPHRNEV